MVQTASLERELGDKGFVNIRRWCRGSIPSCSRRAADGVLDLPRPVFTYVGRVSAEKNLDEFLRPRSARLQARRRRRPASSSVPRALPGVVFTGWKKGEELSRYYSAS